MKKVVKYSAVFLSGDDKQSIKFRTIGEYIQGEKTVLRFSHEDMHVEIVYHGDDLYLKNNGSILHLNTQTSIKNHYMTMYGAIEMITRVESFQANEQSIKLKYGLYDTNLISQVYILISLSDIDDEILVN